MKYIVAFLLLAGVASAQTISDVSGYVMHDSTLTISGSSFGSGGVPLFWEDFDSGTDGAQIDGWNGWHVAATYQAEFGAWLEADLNYGGHGLSAWNDVLDTGFETSYHTFTASSSVYFTWMQRYDYTGSNPTIIKWCRLGDTSDTYDSNTITRLLYDWNDLHLQTLSNHNSIYNDSVGGVSQGAWHRFELWKVLSSPGGTANGAIRLWVDGDEKEAATRTNVVTRPNGDTVDHNSILLGLEGTSNSCTTLYNRNDNMYVSNTLARVEIGDASTFAACTHREIQIPSAWSASEITVTINRGTFAADDGAYLFVVDADGDASPGYQITFGDELEGEGDNSAPGQPTITRGSGEAVAISWAAAVHPDLSHYQVTVTVEGEVMIVTLGSDTSMDIEAPDASDVTAIVSALDADGEILSVSESATDNGT